jgi:hypothetical protein
MSIWGSYLRSNLKITKDWKKSWEFCFILKRKLWPPKIAPPSRCTKKCSWCFAWEPLGLSPIYNEKKCISLGMAKIKKKFLKNLLKRFEQNFFHPTWSSSWDSNRDIGSRTKKALDHLLCWIHQRADEYHIYYTNVIFPIFNCQIFHNEIFCKNLATKNNHVIQNQDLLTIITIIFEQF